MTVFKISLKLFYRNKKILLAFLGIFIGLTFLFGKNIEKNNSVKLVSLKIGVKDNSNTKLSNNLIDYIGKNNTIIQTKSSDDEIKYDLFIHKYNLAIIINDNFEKNVVSNKKALDIFINPNTPSAYFVKANINKFLSYAKANQKNLEFDFSFVDKINKIDKVNINYSSENSNIGWLNRYFATAGYIVLSANYMILGFSILQLLKPEVYKRFLVSSTSYFRFLFEINLSQLLLSIIVVLPIILLPLIFLGKIYLKYILLFGINSYLLALFGNSFANFIISITTKAEIISGIGNVFFLGVSFISGIFVPKEFLGETINTISKIFPQHYYIRLNELILNNKFLSYEGLLNISILFAFSILFFMMSLLIKKEKEII